MSANACFDPKALIASRASSNALASLFSAGEEPAPPVRERAKPPSRTSFALGLARFALSRLWMAAFAQIPCEDVVLKTRVAPDVPYSRRTSAQT